jgi:hypothetical protein
VLHIRERTGKGSGWKNIIIIMYPNEQTYMPNENVNIEKHIKTSLLNTCVIIQNKTPEASTPTDPTPTPTIYNYNQTNEHLQKNCIGIPFGYACDICDRLWYMNDFRQCTVHRVMFQ